LGILIDTSIFIDCERGRLDIQPHIGGREREDCFVSVITASELLHGVHRAKEAHVRSRRAAFVEAIVEAFPVLPIDLPTARIHAQLWAELASSGTMIGPHDSWLAAACIAHGHTLVTGNLRELSSVPGLRVEVWSGEAHPAENEK